MSLPSFITLKPWFPALAVSHSPNELILHEGRIPSYRCRVGPLLSLSLSLFSIARFPSLLSSYNCCQDTLTGPWSVVFSLQVRRWERQGETVKWSVIVSLTCICSIIHVLWKCVQYVVFYVMSNFWGCTVDRVVSASCCVTVKPDEYQ